VAFLGNILSQVQILRTTGVPPSKASWVHPPLLLLLLPYKTAKTPSPPRPILSIKLPPHLGPSPPAEPLSTYAHVQASQPSSSPTSRTNPHRLKHRVLVDDPNHFGTAFAVHQPALHRTRHRPHITAVFSYLRATVCWSEASDTGDSGHARSCSAGADCLLRRGMGRDGGTEERGKDLLGMAGGHGQWS
jgi:hypothetical protein